MFTLKFYSDESSTCISAPHYETYHTDTSITVIIYKSLLKTDGVEYHIRENDFNICFVENETGKTIEKYTLFKEGVKPNE